MKKLFFLTATIFFLFSNLNLLANWIPLDDFNSQSKSSILNNPNQINDLFFAKNDIGLKLNIKALDVQVKYLRGGNQKSKFLNKIPFLKVDLKENNAYTYHVGRPQLPIITRFVEFSGKKENIAINFDGSNYIEYDLSSFGGKKIIPVQQSPDKTPQAWDKRELNYDSKFYKLTKLWPSVDYEIKNVIHIRGRKLALINFYPIKYNPKDNKIYINRDYLIYITTKESNKLKESSSAYNKIFEKMIANYKPSNIEGKSGLESLLVISGDKYANLPLLASYLELKKEIGYKVYFKKMSEIGSSAEDVRNYIKNIYQNSTPKLSYVTIIGDVDDVPVYNGNAGGRTQVTDHFYRAIDLDSYEADIGGPDLMVGRITVNNQEQLKIVLEKIIRYQTVLFPETDWARKVSFVATSDRWQVAEGTHNYAISKCTSKIDQLGNFPTQNLLGGDKLYYVTHNARQADLIRMFKEGRSLIDYSGHGAYTYWAGPKFTGNDIDQIGNRGGALPFVISNACITNAFGRDGDCFGEMWLKKLSGAIAFWGATNNSTWDEDDILEKKMFDILKSDLSSSIGHMTNGALLGVWQSYQGEGRSKYYMEIYNVTGDASIKLLTSVPQSVEVIHNSEYIYGSGRMKFAISKGNSPLSKAFVTLKFKDDIYKTVISNDQGEAIIDINDEDVNVGKNLKLTVWAANSIPYQKEILVLASNQPFLSYHQHQILDENSRLNPGDEIELNLKLKNIGLMVAQESRVTLVSLQPQISVTQSEATYPQAAPQVIVEPIQKFKIKVKKGLANMLPVKFKVLWNVGADQYLGQAFFSDKIFAADLTMLSSTIKDSSGNLNGNVDPGEEGEVTFTVKNNGGYFLNKDLTTINLSSTNSGISIIDTIQFDEHLEIGNQKTFKFRFQVSDSVQNGTKVAFNINFNIDSLSLTMEPSFKVGSIVSETFNSQDSFPIAIPDNNPSGAVAKINNQHEMLLHKINVGVKISHTYVGDLKIFLKSPHGDLVQLRNSSGGSADNIDCNYEDSCRSFQTLNTFYGQSTKGIWELKVSDHLNRDVGSLDSFFIKFSGYAL